MSSILSPLSKASASFRSKSARNLLKAVSILFRLSGSDAIFLPALAEPARKPFPKEIPVSIVGMLQGRSIGHLTELSTQEQTTRRGEEIRRKVTEGRGLEEWCQIRNSF